MFLWFSRTGENTKTCSDLKFGQKEGPKTGNFWNLRPGAWICACERSKNIQTTCYDHSSDLRLLGGHLGRFTMIFVVCGNLISPYHMEKSAEGMEAPKTKFQSTLYPKMFPNVFLCINYLSQSHLFGCGTRCQWFTVPKCASADFSIWYGEMSVSKNHISEHIVSQNDSKCVHMNQYLDK